MNYREFKKRIIIRKNDLTQSSLSFIKYFKASKRNGRLRNNFVFYVLTSRILFIKFLQLAKVDKDAKEMYCNLINALFLAREEKTEIKNIANMLLKKYFNREKPINIEENQVSYEMKKYLKTIVNQYLLEKNITKEDIEYYKKLMNGRTVNDLLSKE